MPSWFTSEETEWMIKHHLHSYSTFDRNERVVYKGKKVGAMKAFIGRVIDEFGHKFPYRHPDTPVSQIPKELQRRQVRKEEYGRNPDDLGSDDNESEENSDDTGSDEWDSEQEEQTESRSSTTRESTEEIDQESALHDQESALGDQNIDESEEEDKMSLVSVGGPSEFDPRDTTEGIDHDTTIRQFDPVDEVVDALAVVTSPDSNVDPAEDYIASPHRLDEWNLALKELGDMMDQSWTGCSPRELQFRRSNVAENLRQVLDIMSWGVGVEFFATGIVASPEAGQGFCTSSSRSDPFLSTDDGMRTMKRFARFAMKHIGPLLCTIPECPGPVVYGDLDRANHPVMPRDDSATTERMRVYIFDYQRHKLRWQGGGLQVPYDRMKADTSEGRHEIVRPERLPTGVEYVENPFTMPEKHVACWAKFLIQCDTAQLSTDRLFQYARPDPDGPEIDGYQTVRSPGVRMDYGPAAHSYALFVQGAEAAIPAERDDGLPQYSAEDAIYHSITDEQAAFWQERLPENQGYLDLLKALKRNDEARPFQAPIEFWKIMAETMPHLKPDAPAPDAGIRQLITEKGRFPVPFFDFRHPLYARFCLHYALNCIKWAVVFLGHLELNVRRVMEDPAAAKAHYASITQHVEIHFTETDKHRIRHTVQLLTDALNESADVLTSSVAEREFMDPNGLALKQSMAAHADFPQSLSQFEWFKVDGSRRVVVTSQEGITRRLIMSANARAAAFENRKGKKRAHEDEPAQTLKRTPSSRSAPESREKHRRRALSPGQSASGSAHVGRATPDQELADLTIVGPSARTRSKLPNTPHVKGKTGRMKMDVVIDVKKK
ncbi:hypothetical protein RSOL_238680, partial [Rhizoctonia solani AG-3 Rhs1AP]